MNSMAGIHSHTNGRGPSPLRTRNVGCFKSAATAAGAAIGIIMSRMSRTLFHRRRLDSVLLLMLVFCGSFLVPDFWQLPHTNLTVSKGTWTETTTTLEDNHISLNDHPSNCRYHGNCPVGTICNTFYKKCLPYYYSSSLSSNTTASKGHDRQRHQHCVDICLEELTIEEQFRFGSVPMLTSTYPASAARAVSTSVDKPGDGCVAEFQRRKQRQVNERPSMEYRLAQQWRSVVRIDPMDDQKNNKNKNDMRRVYCRHPCRSNSDCELEGMTCQGRSLYDQDENRRPPKTWKFHKTCQPHSNESRVQDMVVVSGANSGYFMALENLAASLHYWAPSRRLVVFNLGMQENELRQVQSWPNVQQIHWKYGFPSHYPPHVASDLHNYAWKSLAINESVHEYPSIFWLDAGATFVGPIDPIEEILQLHGLFLVRGQDDHMKRLSHPATYRWFGYDKEKYATGPHYAGGIQGHVYPSRYIDSIVIPNAQCALNLACIAPPNSNMGNHRFDQTSLSILAYQPSVRAPAYTEFLAGGRDQLAGNLSTASTPKIVWTARGSCDYYTDQHGWSGS